MVALLLNGGGGVSSPQTRLTAELIGVLVLVVAIGRGRRGDGAPWGKAPALILAMLFALFALNLVPLPPSVWTALPGRAPFAQADALLGPLPWRPFSLEPEGTMRAALMLVPAIAVFLAVLQGSEARVRAILLAIALFAALSLLRALAQVALPGVSGLHIYPGTHATLPTGWFANRNHQGILFAAALPLLAVVATAERRAVLAIGAGITAACAVGALITGSRTAVALFVPAALATALLVSGRGDRTRWRGFAGAVAGAAMLIGGLALFAGDALTRAAGRGAVAEDSRFIFWPAVVDTIGPYLPWGSGIGSFRRVYEVHEPLALVGKLYLNHAHNDYLELMVETGLPGAMLLLAFLMWVGRATVRLWRTREGPPPLLARAATIAVATLLLHSAIDYPLRTISLATLLAVACALIARAESQAAGHASGRT